MRVLAEIMLSSGNGRNEKLIYIYIYIYIENTSLDVYEEKMCKFVIVFSSLPKRSHFVSGFQ